MKLKNVSIFDNSIDQGAHEFCHDRSANQISVQKEKEDLDDVSGELELADEDELIPYEEPIAYLSSLLEYHAPNQTNILKLQNWRFIHFTTTTRSPGTAHKVDREHRGGSNAGRRKAQYNQGGNDTIEGGIICQIWSKYQSGNIDFRKISYFRNTQRTHQNHPNSMT